MDPTDPQRSAGQTVGPYRLERKLGTGTHNEVWAAQGSEGRVALKLFHTSLFKNPGVKDQLSRQNEALERLDHPLVVRTLGFQPDGPTPYMVFEYVAGESLDHTLAERAKIDAYYSGVELLELFTTVVQAVQHLHERGVIHRNLTPQNLMLTTFRERPALKVLDFGLARILGSDLFESTTLGRPRGPPLYMSPEQIHGDQADEASDIFALGTVLFEMITLRRAWALGANGQWLRAFAEPPPVGAPNRLTDLLERIGTGPRPRPSEIRPELPPPLDDVILRALAIDPEERFSSAGVLLDTLRPILVALPTYAEGDLPTRIADDTDAELGEPPATPDMPTEALHWAASQATERVEIDGIPEDHGLDASTDVEPADPSMARADTQSGPLAPSPSPPVSKKNAAMMPRLANIAPLFEEGRPLPPTGTYAAPPAARRPLAIEKHRAHVPEPKAERQVREPAATPAPISHRIITGLLIVLAIIIGTITTVMVEFWLG